MPLFRTLRMRVIEFIAATLYMLILLAAYLYSQGILV